ncbi:putative Calcium-binding EF hand family protein [Quillaja saponaria]|uniref:Calcium-binding EF hand family protein n=1 Tax=Quillaja saponaria TaxID=32244 RepID=A0AAD7QB26_QUISA|nr:putative Calcium-binding EF hand family protein [Quillaja saponaria]
MMQTKVSLCSSKMSLAVINSSTVTGFVDDKNTFDSSIKECFDKLDDNGDGKLSRDEIRGGFWKLFSLGYPAKSQEIDNIYEKVFEKFDEDKDGEIDRDEFKSLMKEIMLAIARGIGDSPVIVALGEDSLLTRAVQHESTKG